MWSWLQGLLTSDNDLVRVGTAVAVVFVPLYIGESLGLPLSWPFAVGIGLTVFFIYEQKWKVASK